MIGAGDRELGTCSATTATPPKARSICVLNGCIVIRRVALPVRVVIRPKEGFATARASRMHAEIGIIGGLVGPFVVLEIIVGDLVVRVDIAAEQRVCQIAVVMVI